MHDFLPPTPYTDAALLAVQHAERITAAAQKMVAHIEKLEQGQPSFEVKCNIKSLLDHFDLFFDDLGKLILEHSGDTSEVMSA
jgi:hypothetical protein